MIFAGTNTDGHADMIKNLKNNCASRQKRSIRALLCYSCCISRAHPRAPAVFLQPAALGLTERRGRADGRPRRARKRSVRNYAGKPNLCSEKLMQNQKVRVRRKGKASRRWPAQPSCISLQFQRVRFSVTEQAPKK